MAKRKSTKARTPSSKRLKRLRLTHKANDKHDNSSDIVPAVESLLPDFSTSESLANFISSSNGIFSNYVEKKLSNLSYTTKKYERQKINAINRFYSFLRCHSQLSNLADFVADPENPDGPQVTRFVLLARGPKKPAKNKIVNTCCMILAVGFKKKTSTHQDLDWSSFWLNETLFSKEHADCLYQPNVTANYHRLLFKYFHDEGILFSCSRDFNYVGGFQAYWLKLFSLAKAKRPKDFGERPNKACFDVDGDYKIRNCADPPFTPYELSKKGYNDCMLLMCHYTCVDWCLRGATEVSVTD